MRIVIEHEFDAAHHLPGYPGACANVHGHRYRFEVQLSGPTDPATGMVLDFDQLDRLVQARVLAELDHRDLNGVLDNPTAEHIVRWIWERLRPELPGLASVRLWETPRYSVIYDGE